MKEKSIHEQVKAIKHREQTELITAVRQYGTLVDGGHEIYFEDDYPIVAGYLFDEPTDIVIMAVRVDAKGYLSVIGEDKEYRGETYNIEADELFAGQMDYITSNINAYNH